MKTPHSSPQQAAADARLDALLRTARTAPLPRTADRLTIGFGTRAEARLQAALAETAVVSRLLWRWVAGLGACAAIVVATASLGTGTADSATATSDSSSFETDWASYTQVPDVWPQ